MSASSYFVYILASRHHGTIYIGVTNDIRARGLSYIVRVAARSSCRSTRYSASFTSKRSRHRRRRSRARSN
ncbi:putative GIY-YIG superfamily endonuclease [Bradyrhizobium sp. LB13.1]